MSKTLTQDQQKIKAYDRVAGMLNDKSDTDDHELLDNIRSEVFSEE